MTAASVIDLKPTTKESIARLAHRAVSPFDLSVMRERPNGPTTARDEPVHLPKLEAGQIWVIEMSPTDEPSTLHRASMTTGNVIIYDRSLEAIVAKTLSLGGYAEPEAEAKTVQRCVQFAHDGWSVVRLVDRQTSAIRRIAHLRELARHWQRAAATHKPAVFLAAGNGEGARRITPAGDIDRELAATIDQGNLTVVFTATGAVPTSAATPANGLAG
jgi:hypothetical protein